MWHQELHSNSLNDLYSKIGDLTIRVLHRSLNDKIKTLMNNVPLVDGTKLELPELPDNPDYTTEECFVRYVSEKGDDF